MASSEAPDTSLQALQRENLRLRRAVEELSMLNELATAIGAAGDMQKVMQTLIRRSVRAVNAEQGVITLMGEEDQAPGQTLIRTMASSSEHGAFHPGQNLLGWMQLHRHPLLINAPHDDPRFRGVRWEATLRSILCVPLIVRSRLIGILTLYNKRDDRGFNEDDQRLLAIIAGQSAQVIENARLATEETALLRVREELRLAHNIQTNLLPRQPPAVSGYDLAGISLPAQEVGGDYFDFIAVDERRLALCVGDVSGKGLGAALVMANLQATLRVQAHSGRSVKATVEHANRLLHLSATKGTFVTLFYGVLDPRQHTLRYVNAGHNRPLLVRGDGVPRQLASGGLVLGVKPGFAYEEATLALAPGDVLLVYSDGITEAMDGQRRQFEEERLSALLHQHRHASAQALIDHILQAVSAHAGAEPPSDDRTLIALRRLA